MFKLFKNELKVSAVYLVSIMSFRLCCIVSSGYKRE